MLHNEIFQQYQLAYLLLLKGPEQIRLIVYTCSRWISAQSSKVCSLHDYIFLWLHKPNSFQNKGSLSYSFHHQLPVKVPWKSVKSEQKLNRCRYDVRNRNLKFIWLYTFIVNLPQLAEGTIEICIVQSIIVFGRWRKSVLRENWR